MFKKILLGYLLRRICKKKIVIQMQMAVPSFLIKNATSDFLNKQKNLFDHLASAEKETKCVKPTYQFTEIDETKSNKKKRKETKQFRGKESLFKEPCEVTVKFKKPYRVPDFQRNPHKWVKYSLADVTQDDMSNESNTAAALSFLRDIKAQKKLTSIKVEPSEPEVKPFQSNLHQFTLPVKQETKTGQPLIDTDRDSHKPVFKSSKLIMPEYVVGQVKKDNKPNRKKVNTGKVKEVFLNHIHEYEDE